MVNSAGSLVSNSTQLDNIDLMGGARDFTIADVDYNEGAEQPLSIRLAEYERPWKPGLTMRRLLSGIWGEETDEWIGRRVRLFRDETVAFGRQKTGGTRVSHATHISKTVTLTLPISKGKFGEFKVEPLKVDAASQAPTQAHTEPTAEQVAASTDLAELRGWWKTSSPERKQQIEARVGDVQAAQAAQDELPGGEGQ